MTDPLAVLLECAGFEWDDGNSEKNWVRHQVSRAECEEVFFNEPLAAALDEKHSEDETRYYVLGETDDGRRLFLAVTIREQRIRVISARDMNRREEKEYSVAQAEEGSTENTEI
jgi:uncharacterized DUF497 family protein